MCVYIYDCVCVCVCVYIYDCIHRSAVVMRAPGGRASTVSDVCSPKNRAKLWLLSSRAVAPTVCRFSLVLKNVLVVNILLVVKIVFVANIALVVNIVSGSSGFPHLAPTVCRF